MQSPPARQAAPSTPHKFAPASSPAQPRARFSSPVPADASFSSASSAGPKTPFSVSRTPFTTPHGPLTPPDSSNSKSRIGMSANVSLAASMHAPGNAGAPAHVGPAPPIDLTALKPAPSESPLAQRGMRSFNDPAVMQASGNTPALTPSSTFSSTTTSSSGELISDAAGRTPNVYINGLPANFPEDQLFNMTREFGNVVSVRTFTRHVSDRPSGYGFVLFDSCDAAEKCIESLRTFRNLHPSFSKQVHKIPGTAYANVPAARAPSAADPDCFKSKMERLKDTSSTNLYMEGLPLSIDEPTLSKLVAPYQIKSSRFFQTKLSHPPRIIAFVRLESRQACDEVIERLHGRMVRGWEDTGSRISVRVADSNGQRELRRNERTNRVGVVDSPAKITMAQAALLNLHGQTQQPLPSPNFGHLYSPALSHASLEDYPFGYSPVNMTTSLPVSSSAHSRLPPHPLVAPYLQAQTTALPQVRHQDLDPHMASLLHTLQGSTLSHAPGVGGFGAPVLGRPSQGTASRAKYNGFTPMEQHLILRAREERQLLDAQRQAMEAQQQLQLARQAAIAREREMQAQNQAQQQRAAASVKKAFAPIELMPAMSEDAFHSAGRAQQQQERVRTRTNGDPIGHGRPTSLDYGHPDSASAAPHARSTTLPYGNRHRASTGVTIAPPATTPVLSSRERSTSQGINAGSKGDDGPVSAANLTSPAGSASSASSAASGQTEIVLVDSSSTLTGSRQSFAPTFIEAPRKSAAVPIVDSKAPTPMAATSPAEEADSPLISPALSYSSRGSPSMSSTATLSPMTPAFVPGQLHLAVAGVGNVKADAANVAIAENLAVVGLGVDMGPGSEETVVAQKGGEQ